MKCTSTIMFVPICTRCGTIITEQVDLEASLDCIANTPHKFINRRIIPEICPNCAAIFNQIEMPGGVPYKIPMRSILNPFGSDGSIANEQVYTLSR